MDPVRKNAANSTLVCRLTTGEFSLVLVGGDKVFTRQQPGPVHAFSLDSLAGRLWF